MNKELDKKLCDTYPLIFKNRNASMRDSCMHWGMECGDGWYKIIDDLCYAMTWLYKTSVKVGDKYVSIEPPQVIADQVKEKFGTLRFYFHLEYEGVFKKLLQEKNEDALKTADHYNNYIDGIVHFAETQSGRTCEETGKSGRLHVAGGWYKTINEEYSQTILKDRQFKPVS